MKIKIINFMDRWLVLPYLRWTENVRAKLAEQEPAVAEQIEQTKVVNAKYNTIDSPGKLDVSVQSPVVPIIADAFWKLLKESGGKNYLEMELWPQLERGLPPMLLTAQYKKGVSPGNMVRIFESALIHTIQRFMRLYNLNPDDLPNEIDVLIPWEYTHEGMWPPEWHPDANKEELL